MDLVDKAELMRLALVPVVAVLVLLVGATLAWIAMAWEAVR